MYAKRVLPAMMCAVMLLFGGSNAVQAAGGIESIRQDLVSKQAELEEVEAQIAEQQAIIDESQAALDSRLPEGTMDRLTELVGQISARLKEEGLTDVYFDKVNLGITTMEVPVTEFEDINAMMEEYRDKQHLWYTNLKNKMAATNAQREATTALESLSETKAALESEIAELQAQLELPFEDVTEDSWCYDVVWDVYQKGLMTGMNATTFEPETTLNRAFMAAVLYRRAGYPVMEYSDIFPDVPGNEWYTQCVMWAKDVGIILGYDDGTFGPTDSLNREQLCTILWRCASEMDGLDNSAQASIADYADAENITDFAVEAIQWCEAMGILNYRDGRIAAWEEATRADCAWMISKYLEATGQER